MAYETLANLKSYLGIAEDATGDDTLLTALLNAATARIEADTHRVFEAASGTRYYGPEAVDGDVLWLDADLYSVTSITNGESQTITEYWLLPRNKAPYYQIKLKDGSDYSWTFDTDGEIAIVGKWGYSETPPADIVYACKRLAGYYYRLKDSQTFDVTSSPETGQLIIPKGIPADVKLILANYRRGGAF